MKIALAAFLCACAAAQSTVRVALYVGAGSAATSAGNLSAVFTAMRSRGAIATLTELQAADVASSLTPNAFDVFVVPGGTGSGESNAIGADGANAVRSFVRGGGGYYGTCAGGFLAGNVSCCAQAMAGYCGGAIGCVESPTALGLVDMGVAEPWDRGHGMITLIYTDAAVAALQLDVTKYGNGQNVSVLYWQGPIQSRLYKGKFDTLATFTSEIDYLHPQWTTGEMVNTPALLTTTYGSGRVLISSPHPEETIPRLDDIVEAYLLWAAKAI
jgi:hypothetical protein